jgi:hypothetical protein
LSEEEDIPIKVIVVSTAEAPSSFENIKVLITKAAVVVLRKRFMERKETSCNPPTL